MAKATAEIRSLARVHSKTALKVLVGIMRKENAPAAARVTAASLILDRGWGKPDATVTINDKRDATDWNRDELVSLLNDSRKSSEGASKANGRSGQPDRVH